MQNLKEIFNSHYDFTKIGVAEARWIVPEIGVMEAW